MLNSTCPVADDCVVLGTGEPWEIFFFVSEVVAGAHKGHFNDQHRSMGYVMRQLSLACVKAILARRLGWRSSAAPRFVVVRRQGHVCGAMLLKPGRTHDGLPLLSIEYMVVAASARRAGVGRTLVDYARRHAPAGGLECYCTEASRGMQRLLKRLDFIRTHRAKEIVVARDERVSVPSRWYWQA